MNNARDMLEQSQHALDRIADHTYGQCENCGNPIGKNRLMAKIMNKEWRALPKKQQAVILDLRDQVSQLWDDALEVAWPP